MKVLNGLTPGRRIALGAAVAAVVAGIVVAIVSGGGGKPAHRPPHAARGISGGPTVAGEAGSSTAAPGKGPGTAGEGSGTAGKGRPKPGTGGNGAGVGNAAPRPQHPALLQVAAGYLGLPPQRLRRELAGGHTLAQIASTRPGRSAAGLVEQLVAARMAAIRAAAAEGRISKDVEARRLSRVRKVITTAVTHARPGAGTVPVALRQAAAYLGIEVKKLRGQLRSGRTLAQIADSTPGRSANGLLDTLVASRRAVLDRLVKAGHLKKEREQPLLATYRARLSARIRQRTAG